MLDEFIIRALLGGIAVAIAAGPLGSFIMWKKMAFFGDALSHSAILGVVVGIILGINQSFSIALFALVFSAFIALMQRHKFLEGDTILGLAAHGALAIGMVVLSLYDPAKLNLNSLLFGDILATSYTDIKIMYSAAFVLIGAMCFIWRQLLISTISEDLARVDGVNVPLISFIFTAMVALMVALSIKIVGVLLVSSLLIIPAAIARIFSKNPEFMAIMASVFGVLSICLGMALSLHLDIPTGPSVVVALLGVFVVASVVGRRV